MTGEEITAAAANEDSRGMSLKTSPPPTPSKENKRNAPVETESKTKHPNKETALLQVERVEGEETKAVVLSKKDIKQSANRLRNRLEAIKSL